MKAPGRSIGGQAVFWNQSEPTIKRERDKGAPLHDIEATREWYGSRRTPKGIRTALDQTKKKPDGLEAIASEPKNAKAWEEFEQLERSDDPKDAMAKIAKARDFAAFMLEKAWKAEGKVEDIQKEQKHFSDLLAKMEACLHDAQLRAKKLGVDSGELLPRPEVERIVFAMAFWLLRSSDMHQDSLTSKLRALAPGLDGEPIRSVLDGELLNDRFLIPFAQAAKIQNGVSLPEWVVAAMRRACGDFLSEGEARFDEEAYAAP